MSGDPDSPERERNPLAGVLSRLLDRERGRDAARPAGEEPGAETVAETPRGETHPRRMLAIAALGADRGEAALRTAAQWAKLLGRTPAVTDLCCGETPSTLPAGELGPASSLEGRVARALVPWELERVQQQPAEVVLALLERLRRHESSSDLSLVRIPLRQRRALMRAAFLSGALVVPIDESGDGLRDALEVTRDVLENFLEVAVWPFSPSPSGLERYLSSLREVRDVRVTPCDPGRLDLAAALRDLPAAPPEGFLVGLLAPEPADLPADLLRLDTLEL